MTILGCGRGARVGVLGAEVVVDICVGCTGTTLGGVAGIVAIGGATLGVVAGVGVGAATLGGGTGVSCVDCWNISASWRRAWRFGSVTWSGPAGWGCCRA